MSTDVRKQFLQQKQAYSAVRHQEKIPKTPLGVWHFLVEKKYFLTSREQSKDYRIVSQQDKDGQTKHWYPTDDQWAWFDWVLAQKGHFMFMGARKIGKTELLTIFQVVWMILSNPNFKCIIITGTDERGKFLVGNIYDMVRDLAVPLVSDAKTFIKTAANKSKSPNVRYHGINSRIKGDHVDLIIIDDPLDEKEGHSVEKRRTVSLLVKECLSMADRVMMIGQYVHEDDIFREYDGAIPTMTAWRSQYPHLVTMSEEQYCRGSGGNTRRSYLMNYEGIIIPDSEAVFADVQFTSRYPQKEPTRGRCFAFIDPALEGSDRTAVAVGMTYHDAELNHKVLVAWLFSWRTHYVGCILNIAKLIKVLGVDQVWYEDQGGNNLLLAEKLVEAGVRRPTPFFTHENKILKIQSIAGLVKLGYIRVHTDTQEAEINLLRNWTPLASHDDVPDSLAMLARHVFGLGIVKGIKK